MMPMVQIRPRGLVRPEDIPAHEVSPDFWTDAQNVAFRNAFAERIGGWRPIYDANATVDAGTSGPQFLLNNNFQGTVYWLYGTENEIGVTDTSGTHTDLTPVSGAPSGVTSEGWSGCELNGYPILNWGVTAGPHSWDRSTSSNVAPLADWPSGYTCQVIRAHRFHLVALNIGGAVDWPSVALWSDAAGPGLLPDDGAGTTWTAAGGNEAGSLSFGDVGEGINDGLSLRENFIVYKGHSAYVMFPDDTLIYGQRPFLRTTGCLASNCVVEWQGNHFVLTDGDLIVTDGNQARSVIDGSTRRALFRNIDQDNYTRSFLALNLPQNELWACVPEAGQEYPNRALVLDLTSGAVQEKDVINIATSQSFRDLFLGGSGCAHIAGGNVSETVTGNAWSDYSGTTWAAITELWSDTDTIEANDGIVGADPANEELVLLDFGNTYPDGSLQARVSRESLDLGDSATVKLVTEVWPRIVGTAGDLLQIRVGSQMEPDQPVEWSGFQPFVIGTDTVLHTFARGRYISVEAQSTDGNSWRLTGFDMKVEQAGRY